MSEILRHPLCSAPTYVHHLHAEGTPCTSYILPVRRTSPCATSGLKSETCGFTDLSRRACKPWRELWLMLRVTVVVPTDCKLQTNIVCSSSRCARVTLHAIPYATHLLALQSDWGGKCRAISLERRAKRIQQSPEENTKKKKKNGATLQERSKRKKKIGALWYIFRGEQEKKKKMEPRSKKGQNGKIKSERCDFFRRDLKN